MGRCGAGAGQGITWFSLSLPWSGTVLTSVWLFAFCWLTAGDLEGLLTQARADPSRVTGFLPGG
jgi:hypothetical protein